MAIELNDLAERAAVDIQRPGMFCDFQTGPRTWFGILVAPFWQSGRILPTDCRALILNVCLVILAVTGLLLPVRAALAEGTIALELQEVVPDAAIPGQFPEVTSGHINSIDPSYGNYSSDHTWSAPPATIGPDGFTLTLQVQAENKAGSGITAGTQASGTGFDFAPSDASAWARVAANGQPGSESSSLSVTVKPSSYLTPGATAELRVSAAYGPGVVYRYRVVSGDAAGNGDDQGGDGSQPPRQLNATLECDSSTIVISALPSLNCHIHISGWTRNTAEPVFVDLPAALDTFGNHANGIQVHTGGGQQDVFNWVEPEYSWGIFVFACPSQQGTGANCYGQTVVPGTSPSVPIVVRQGAQSVQLMLTLNAVGRGSNAGGVPVGSPVRFGNRWMAGDFLNIESGTLVAGSIRADWLSAIWVIEPVEGTEFVRLRNMWKPDVYIHTENRIAEAGPIQPEWWSAMWVVEPVQGTRYIRIRNRWIEGAYLNTESGALQISQIAPTWDSALWWTME